jgi:hypothetical protein
MGIELMQRMIGGGVVIGLMLLSFVTGRMIGGFHKLPALAATLPGDEKDFSQELDVKIREEFPVGSSEESLIRYLKAEGFMPDWRQRNEPNIGSVVHNGLLCKKIVQVFWRADPQGLLTEINGSYESECI